jgi:hypothetical protein
VSCVPLFLENVDGDFVTERCARATRERMQRCIRNYVDCKNEGWTGNCHDCIHYCAGQREWPRGKCRERRKMESP